MKTLKYVLVLSLLTTQSFAADDYAGEKLIGTVSGGALALGGIVNAIGSYTDKPLSEDVSAKTRAIIERDIGFDRQQQRIFDRMMEDVNGSDPYVPLSTAENQEIGGAKYPTYALENAGFDNHQAAEYGAFGENVSKVQATYITDPYIASQIEEIDIKMEANIAEIESLQQRLKYKIAGLYRLGLSSAEIQARKISLIDDYTRQASIYVDSPYYDSEGDIGGDKSNKALRAQRARLIEAAAGKGKVKVVELPDFYKGYNPNHELEFNSRSLRYKANALKNEAIAKNEYVVVSRVVDKEAVKSSLLAKLNPATRAERVRFAIEHENYSQFKASRLRRIKGSLGVIAVGIGLAVGTNVALSENTNPAIEVIETSSRANQ
jgi:hypothetical protein